MFGVNSALCSPPPKLKPCEEKSLTFQKNEDKHHPHLSNLQQQLETKLHRTTSAMMSRDEEERMESPSAVVAVVASSDDDTDVDIEMGSLPIIELPESLKSLSSPSVCDESSVDGSGASIRNALAVVQPPPGDDGMINPVDLESTLIANLVTTPDHHSHRKPATGSVHDPQPSITVSSESSQTDLPLSQRRAEFISATISKPSKNTPIGLELIDKDDNVIISAISPGSLTSHTPFHVGDRLLSVNTKRCYILESKDITKHLDSLEGSITIVVHNQEGDPNLVESMITKPVDESRCGLGLVSAGQRRLRVSQIDADGLFFDSLLNVGDPILSINGENCEFCDAADAGEMIARAGRIITIKAKTLLETGVVVAAFSVNNSIGSTIPPQVINAMNRAQANEPSMNQVMGLFLSVILMIGVVLIMGLFK
ncbi:expressed unknown protein [Seminavis robusta]|uniref:PDZ domain-containing protein n=1 Tax=Seminavis robusta TaxID=568900 RepID=A0A9N8EBF2_9STRA|nr:expressed unknown protein [Seminavis robusta]|eukprot:Sro900_g217910.1 n/a (425) ;mRNA; r:40591-41865